ncbi:MAG: aldo/keto reductase [Chloroflexi bacterium]|nr:aldo/keto reductase [Chloroflexota bacterium]MBP7045475.1 aldo/keto reductase [Chloroflexota bacterium]
MEYRELGQTGLNVSALSFGASSLGNVFRKVNEADGIRTVHTCVDRGINLIDVSPYYGLTLAETVLGKALKTIPRDKYYLATKVGRYGENSFDFSAARVTASVDESLRRLNVEYVDIIQCHDIEFGALNQVVNETIPALRRLQETGKVRFVGITGLPLKAFEMVAEQTAVDTILSYCRYSLNDTSLADKLPYFQQKGIGVISASPLSMGLLTDRGAPDWHPAPTAVRTACAQAAAHCRARGADIAQLALQFSLAHPGITTTMVGTADPNNMVKNIEWADNPPDPELLADVQAILAPIHNQTWLSGRPENN